ncbi:MAG: mannose-1-phosphate guanylyltransferase [Candidatus Micrarchaeaceae archaeon]
MSTKALILAGGSGTRFWPKSTKDKPKQFLKITSDKTMIQETFERIHVLININDIYVVSNENHLNHVYDQLNIAKDHLLLEPEGKNTAPAIAFGISGMDPEDVVVVLPSDHYIHDEKSYLDVLKSGIDFASKHDAIITIGIRPNKPETGYGYMEVDKALLEKDKIILVKRFHEKPNLETAYHYLESGNFFWNSGIFIFKVSVMKKAYKEFLPEIYERFFESKGNDLKKIYKSVEPISIDYGIMEKARNIFMIPGDFGWSDVGSWDALYDLIEKDENGNYSDAKQVIFRDAKHCGVFAAGKTIAISHLEDIIVVVDGDKILVTRRGTTQDVKHIKF